MSLFKTFAITVYPRINGTRVKGRWSDTEGTPYTIYGSWQPATDLEVNTLPEGRRSKESFTFYADEKLNTIRENNTPDRVKVNSVEYELFSRSDSQNILKHYKYLVVAI